MVECKDFHKGIIQLQWEHKMMGMQIEDHKNQARDIQMLQLSEEHQHVSVIRIIKHPDTLFVLAFLSWITLDTGLASVNNPPSNNATG